MIAAVSNDTARIEAFSDGVFAIAITLLVLDLKVPRELHEGQTLTAALAHQWPSYAAYVVSFLVIGVMWVNHHALFGHLAKVDRVLVFLNLLLLKHVTQFTNLLRRGTPFLRKIRAEVLVVHGTNSGYLIWAMLMQRTLGVRTVVLLTDPPSPVPLASAATPRHPHLRRIDQLIEEDQVRRVRVCVPQKEGKALALLEAKGRISSRKYTDGAVELDVEAPESVVRRVQEWVVKGQG